MSEKKLPLYATAFLVHRSSFIEDSHKGKIRISTGFARAAGYGGPYPDCGLRTASVAAISTNDERYYRRSMRYLNLIRFRPVAFQKLRAIFSEMI